jgi:hypothetical protein
MALGILIIEGKKQKKAARRSGLSLSPEVLLQARECEFRLASGRKCRAAANRHQPFCRHHAPAPAISGPPPIPKRDRYSNLIRWRQLRSRLHSMPVDEIPSEVWNLLQCLVDRGIDSTGRISDLTAGRFLRVLLTRFGDVPFPDPDLAFASEPSAAPASRPGALPAAPGFSAPQAGGPSAQDLSALFAALGLPPAQAPRTQPRPQPHSSYASLNQTRAQMNQ